MLNRGVQKRSVLNREACAEPRRVLNRGVLNRGVLNRGVLNQGVLN